MMAAFDDFQREVHEHIGARSTVIKLSASEGMTKHWLLPRLKRLRDANDRLMFEVHSTASRQSLDESDLDLVIRIGDPGDDELIGKRVGEIAFGLYASPAYLQSRPPPRAIDQLNGHALIGLIANDLRSGPAADERPPLMSRFHSIAAASAGIKLSQVGSEVAAASAGLGLALLAVPFAEAEGLSRVLPNEEAILDIWLLHRRETERRMQSREVREFIEKEMELTRGWLSGRKRTIPDHH
ncbi:hypothetical protein SSBR45G_47090 [Bradyrhizobium sp. SSBR45G]|nr:hypothetical protein SSBR45G_47090 [Bradyrhizobium sp. SSBR45G]GLH87081.1 hypothetical protein SSBR45R_45410 [Bradyrhizobium sp. SSBR45R]